MKRTFRPEFLNRIDEYIIFRQFTQEELAQIVDLMVGGVRQRLMELSIEVELTAAAKEWLVREGFDPVFGARPLRRAIQLYVENDLAKRVLAGEFDEGDVVEGDAGTDSLTFSKKKPAAAKKKVAAATA